MPSQAANETATLAGGCFWCLEAFYEELNGVISVESGYSGGTGTPSYHEVSSGETGHAEAVQIVFNTDLVSYQEILAVFFTMHDPTTLNRQGADVGTQYRSVVFYHSPEQKATAQAVMAELAKDKVYANPIVTRLQPFEHFYKAEDYHQNYYQRNRAAGYCRAVIDPKMRKFREKFTNLQR